MRWVLTFDDGPGPSTGALLDVLDAAGVRATFFVLGRNVEEAPWDEAPGGAARARALAVRALRGGHALGNHSWSHQYPIDGDAFLDELDRVDALIRALRREAGVAVDTPIPVRLPFGPQTDDARLAALARRGRAHAHWSAAFEDWTRPPAGALAEQLCAYAARHEHDPSPPVLLLHDGGISRDRHGYDRSPTVEAVRRLCAQSGLL